MCFSIECFIENSMQRMAWIGALEKLKILSIVILFKVGGIWKKSVSNSIYLCLVVRPGGYSSYRPEWELGTTPGAGVSLLPWNSWTRQTHLSKLLQQIWDFRALVNFEGALKSSLV